MILEDKVALVTGSATGIGRAIALSFAQEGAHVINCDINKQGAEETTHLVKQKGRRSMAIQLDVTKKEEIQQSMAKILDEFGRLDIACNNAGVSTMNNAFDLTEDEWDFNMDVNAKGVFFCCQVEGEQMMKQGFGKIINTASMAAKRGIPLLSHYCASKYAVVGFSKSLALELAPYKITVNCVCPGLVKTSMQEREIMWEAELKKTTPEAIQKEYLDMTPLGRLEEPEDVAKVFVFLASPAADFMTGQAINVTGGIETN